MAVGDLPVPVKSTVNATAASGEKVPFNGKRVRIYMENLSTLYDVWIYWGTAAVIGEGRRLQADGGAIEIEIDTSKGDDWAKDSIHMIATGASADVAVEELSS
ncbi:hypothetical protein LCGC14_0258860 [marine sediment metagenome]|uniref:Uncharacterized protein n=1 Tax=marine sediment metagenome TaxID=412755 RepID=A0A0F9WMT9_9ZZZZ